MRKLREKRGGSAFVEMASLYIVFIMLLALGMSALNVYARHNLVNAMAHEIARYVEIKGIIDAGTHAEFARLKQASGLTSATVSFDRTGRIPLEAPFTVTVTVKEKFGIGGIQVIPVEVKAVSTGRSEVYWK